MTKWPKLQCWKECQLDVKRGLEYYKFVSATGVSMSQWYRWLYWQSCPPLLLTAQEPLSDEHSTTVAVS